MTVSEWAFLAVAVAAVLAATIVAVRAQRQRDLLLRAYEDLRVAVASGLVGDEALRVSVARGVIGDRKLRASVARGLVGDEKLRVSVASGLVGDEALRVSVADGLDGAEALRISVAQGLDAASAALAVVDTVDAGITFYDPDGVILLTNDTARALVDSGGGQPLVFEDDRVTPIPEIDQILARAARGQLVTRRAYWTGVGEKQRAMMATSQYVRRASGELIGTVVATHDVTPLAAAIQARDEFLETVSHELRTPLTSMIGYLEIIEDSVDLVATGIGKEFAVVQRNSQRLLKLIVDLLLTAEGQTSVERRPFDIAEIVANSLNAIRPAASVLGIGVSTEPLTAVVAEVDADRIGDVIDKLLSNALKFTHSGGSISATVASVGDDVVVRVTDTGSGVTDADRAHIFERFYRSSDARRGVVAGAGLGLSTAKLIVDSHHGSIDVESVIEQGTTIEVRLPLRAG